MRKVLLPLTLALFSLGAMGSKCSEGTTTVNSASATCATGVVQIAIHDGMLGRLCGCVGAGETDGSFVAPGTSLTCTPSANPAQVFFVFVGKAVRSQIVPVGSNTFVSSPVYIPGDKPLGMVHSVQMAGAAATVFNFKDQFNSTVLGAITLP